LLVKATTKLERALWYSSHTLVTYARSKFPSFVQNPRPESFTLETFEIKMRISPLSLILAAVGLAQIATCADRVVAAPGASALIQ
jgi:hypothetical protein